MAIVLVSILLAVALSAVLLCIPFTVGFVGAWLDDPADSWETYDWGGLDSEDWSWGNLQVSENATPIYAQPNTYSGVLETRHKGDVLEYYGFDDSLTYFKVKTSRGDIGWLESTRADLSY